jgi:FixJ family two-component response regulator
MSQSVPWIYVVDDDLSVRESVESLIRSIGLSVKTFSSAREFLASLGKELPLCLVLDIQLPEMNGFELQQELARKDIQIPTIFLTGHGDIPMSVRAIKAGAVEFLTKPFEDECLLKAMREAIALDDKNWRTSGGIAGAVCEDQIRTDGGKRSGPNQPEIVTSTRVTRVGRLDKSGSQTIFFET